MSAMFPKRIQRRRTKGWRMPRNAVYVGRGTPWGNRWKVGERDPATGAPVTRKEVVARYRAMLEEASPESLTRMREHLAGKDLACWCRPDQECHADVLLEFANQRPAVDGSGPQADPAVPPAAPPEVERA